MPNITGRQYTSIMHELDALTTALCYEGNQIGLDAASNSVQADSLREALLKAATCTREAYSRMECPAMPWIMRNTELFEDLFEPLAFFRQCLGNPGVTMVLCSLQLLALVPRHERVQFIGDVMDRYAVVGDDWIELALMLGMDHATLGRLVLDNLNRAARRGGKYREILVTFAHGEAVNSYALRCRYPISLAWLLLGRRQLHRALQTCAIHVPEVFLKVDRHERTMHQMGLRLSQAQITGILVCASRHMSSFDDVAFRALDHLPLAARRAMLWRLNGAAFTKLLYMIFVDPDMQYALHYMEALLGEHAEAIAAYRDWCDTTDLPGELLADDPLNPATRLHNGLLRNPALVAQVGQLIMGQVFVAKAGTDTLDGDVVINVPDPDGNVVQYVQHPYDLDYTPTSGDQVVGHRHDPRNVELKGGVIGVHLAPRHQSRATVLGFR